MYIPQIMKDKIANTFYDKTISLMTANTSTDSEGGVTYRGLTTTSTFNGNVNYSNCTKIQEEYGLDYQIDISITTNTDTSININDIIKYDNITYVVKDILRSDSHILIVAVKWR